MKRVTLFTLFACALAWAPCVWLMANPAAAALWMVPVFAGCMFTPALASLLCRLVTREGFSDMKLRPHLKGHVRVYLIAWFGPTVLIALGAALWFLLNPSAFDLSMSTLAAGLGREPEALRPLIYSQILLGAAAGPAINFIPTLGEELGWRGYLLPRLRRLLSPRLALLVTGVIWGLWHAPMIALGHNYGTGYAGAPWGGILMMVLFCVGVGALMGYVSVRADSALPAALAHAGLNALAGSGAFFAVAGTTNPFVGPSPTGFVGGAAFFVTAAVLFWKAPRWMPDLRETGAAQAADTGCTAEQK